MNDRKTSIEMMRFTAAVMVVLVHIRQLVYPDNGIAELAFIAVEFFFMLTGYFAMRDASETSDSATEAHDAVVYVWKKAKGMFGLYFFAQMLMFLIRIIENGSFVLMDILKQFFHFKWEFLMIHMIGFIPNPAFDVDYLLPTAWFISSLLLALFPFYFLARRFGKSFSGVAAPVCMLMIYAYIIQNYETLDVGNQYVFGTFLANYRAFAGLCAGAFVYYLNDHYMKIMNTEKGRFIVKILDLGAWIMTLSVFVIPKDVIPDYDMVLWMIPFAVILLHGVNNIGPVSHFFDTYDNVIWGGLGSLSIYIFLLHIQVIHICRHLFATDNSIAGSLIILAVSVMFSFVVKEAFELIRKPRRPVN